VLPIQSSVTLLYDRVQRLLLDSMSSSAADLQDDDVDYMPPNKKRKGNLRPDLEDSDSDDDYVDEVDSNYGEIEPLPVVHDPGPDPEAKLDKKGKGDDTVDGDGNTPEKVGKASIKYHCDYCRKDITDSIRIKCSVCTDFDLCIECFSVGVEVNPHKKSHQYQVVDNMHFPLFNTDWGADEEILLLEAIEMYGLGNWGDVADHVGTKSAADCKSHYFETYINVPTAPLPDMSKVLTTNATLQMSTRKRITNSSDNTKDQKAKDKPKNSTQGSKTLPKISNKEIHAALVDSLGYMKGRNEFETEYDNDAETLIRDIAFDEDDDPQDRELKLKVLEMYNQKLDERARRRKFIIENGLLDYKKVHQQDRRRSKEDRDLYNNMRVFLQVMNKEEYEQLLQGMVYERQLRRRIEQLKHWRSNGIRTLAEGELYEIERQRRENSLKRAKDSSYLYTYGDKSGLRSSSSSRHTRYLARTSDEYNRLDKMRSRPRKPGQPLELEGMPGVELLSPKEKQVCSTLRLLPKQYMLIKDTLLAEHAKTGYLKKQMARQLVKIDVNKTSKIFEFFEQSGWINRPQNQNAQQNLVQQPTTQFPQTSQIISNNVNNNNTITVQFPPPITQLSQQNITPLVPVIVAQPQTTGKTIL
jgi:transcriptional adapter 2-alpha